MIKLMEDSNLAVRGVIFAALLIELLFYARPLWNHRKVFGPLFLLISFGISAFQLVMFAYSLPLQIFIAIVASYRFFNIVRASYGLAPPARLLRNSFTTSWRLGLLTALTCMAAFYLSDHFLLQDWMLFVSVAFLAVALLCFQALRISVSRMKLPVAASNYASRDLPSITVAIPARNETKDLQECLRSLIATHYPKLEIITLDDCSQERRTPEIIRQFAHDGVRFLKGELPPEPWLAKNYAYEQLLRASSGEYILFCGVDARFEPGTINRLLEGVIESNKDMISLMPINHVSRGKILPYLIQPIRYAWEIALPRRWRKRPPVLSTCWVVKRSFLEGLGGFSGVMKSIQPERHFARQALKNQSYGFYHSAGSGAGLTSIKSGREQLNTAIRTRYPTVKRAPEKVLLLSLAEVGLAALPLFGILYGYYTQHPVLIIVNCITIILMSLIYGVIDKITYQSWKLVSFIAMPFALVYDALILNISMYRYEFSKVLWKGRNICLPLLQAIPNFPKLPKEHRH